MRLLQEATSSRRLDGGKNQCSGPAPGELPWSALTERSLFKTPGLAPAQGANKQSREALTWSSDEVRARGKSLCSVHKQGKLRVTGHSMPDVSKQEQNSPEQQETSTKHGSAQET